MTPPTPSEVLAEEIERLFPAEHQPRILFRCPGEPTMGAPTNLSFLMERVIATLRAGQPEGIRDKDRLDWLDAHPEVILRSGKQHIRPLIDAAMLNAAASSGGKMP